MLRISCLAIAVIALAFFSNTPSSAKAQASKRTLRFPTDRAVGVVYQRPFDESRDDFWNQKDWSIIGDAQADIQVDATAEVRLAVSNAASAELSFFDKLQPDDLHTLELGRTRVRDDQLAHIGRLTGLRVLDLEQTRVSDAGIAHLAALKKLRRIDLEAFGVNREGFGVGDAALAVLATLPELETIDLRLTKITDAGLKHLASLRSLKALQIPGTQVTDAGVAYLKQLPHLEHLRLGVYDEGIRLTDDGLRDVGQITTLKSLDLSGTMITNAGLAHLHGLKHLEDLSLDETQITQEGLSQLEPLQSLRALRCYLNRPLDDDGADAVSRLKSLRRLTTFLELTDKGVAALAALPHLESFDLRGEGVTDAALEHVGRMTSLKELDLHDCPITDAGLAKLAALENLEALGLSDTQVTSRGTLHLQNLPKLNRLRLRIDDDSLSKELVIPNLKFIGGLSQLKSLTLSIPRLTDRDLVHVATLHNLQELTLEDMPVGDMGAFYLSGLASLTQLSLEGSVITDDGLTWLANLRRLTYLDLDGHFTDKGILHLTKIKSLQHVYLSSPYLTDQGIAALAAAVPSIMKIRQSRSGSPLPEVSYRDYDTFRREGLEADRADKNALELKSPPPWELAGWVNADADGLTLDELVGKVVLVDFWGTWCGPCRAAMPKLKSLHKKYPNDLVILGIHTTSGAEQMADYVAAEKIPWPNACDVDKQTVASWHIDSYPDVCVIDRNGVLRVADLYLGDLERAIRELVAEKADHNAAEELTTALPGAIE
jgi:Leucine-rich repeat (LRR) protein/thiol-disulfide isomerase/thioredoxin